MNQFSLSFVFFFIFICVNGSSVESSPLGLLNAPSTESIQCEPIYSENKICKFKTFLERTRRKLFHGNANYTIFALTDGSFGGGNNTQNLISGDASQYVYPGRQEKSNIRDGQKIRSIGDQHQAFVNLYYDRITRKTLFWIQAVEVTTQSLKDGNNLFHVIDQTLEWPQQTLFEYLKKSGKHKILFDKLEKYKLYFQFPFGVTFFAPLDEAFAKIPQKYKEKIFKDDISTMVS